MSFDALVFSFSFSLSFWGLFMDFFSWIWLAICYENIVVKICGELLYKFLSFHDVREILA